jgi:hypothetical protein
MFAPKFPSPGEPVSALARAAIYGLLGCAMELAFTALTSPIRRRPRGPSSSPVMLAVYALALPLFEPVHNRLRGRVRLPFRAAIYGAGFEVIEFASGALLRRYANGPPWDYSPARLNLAGLVRLDYLPLWAIVGLGAERLHDGLMGRRRGPAR